MKVERVTATIKYSQDTRKGAWKAVELGAEVTVDAKDSWQDAQHKLYGELRQQLHTLWANGKTAQNDSQSHVEAARVPEPTATPPELPAHHCEERQTPDRGWCRES